MNAASANASLTFATFRPFVGVALALSLLIVL